MLPTPAKVKVNVYNATATSGLASKTANELEDRGFRVGKVANDPVGKPIPGVAEIRFGAKGAQDAQLLLLYVPGAELVELDRKGRNVDLATGTGFTGLAPQPEVAAAAGRAVARRERTGLPEPGGWRRRGCDAVSHSMSAARVVSRVEDKVRLGPDAQVDDKAIIIMPRDPRATDPFLALAEDWFSEPGFEWHPHRGIETVTMVLDGVLEHGDNAGNAGALMPGDVQWMTAGRGIIHRELAFRNEHAHTLQLWVNLPARRKMVETGYQDLRATSRPRTTIAGRAGRRRLRNGRGDDRTGAQPASDPGSDPHRRARRLARLRGAVGTSGLPLRARGRRHDREAARARGADRVVRPGPRGVEQPAHQRTRRRAAARGYSPTAARRCGSRSSWAVRSS